MRIIQSAWACNQSNILTSNSGWLSPEYNLMSWTLSCLQLKQFYPEVVLYCDQVYAEMLIDNLQLPYSDVVCNLDDLNKYHPQLWALPKIYTYSQQEKPFLHVDGDVFIWKEFSDQLLKGDLIAQNIEAATDYYQKIMTSLELGLSYFPNEIVDERKSKKPILAYNAGILGGNDISFFKEYTSKAFEFVDKNRLHLSKINISSFNIFFEQYLFYCLVNKQNKKVNVLIPETIGDNQYKGFGDFTKVPYEKHYLHLLGNYKKNDYFCKQMADRLRQDYPEYYYRIIELYKKNKKPLFADYYYTIENTSEKCLMDRYNYLKSNYLKIAKNESINSLRFDAKRKLKKELGNFKMNKDQYVDFEIFSLKINSLLKKNLALLSNDYLYARDCNHNYYYQYLFEDQNDIYTKKIIRDENYHLVKSKYNWTSFIEAQKIKKENEDIALEEAQTDVSTLVIPECNQDRFSLVHVDELDLVILEILKEIKTVQELFNELKEYFDSDELKKFDTEFEKLIFGRIKLGLHSKSIIVKY